MTKPCCQFLSSDQFEASSKACVPGPLSGLEVARFDNEGYLLLRGHYDREREIEPIQRAIYGLIGILLKKYGLSDQRPAFDPTAFDVGLPALLGHDRRIGGELYDAVKQIPAFVRLVASPVHEMLLRQLRKTELPGVAAGGYGIRMDHPGEDQYRAPWHQEYPAQFRSLDGIVFWSPLVAMTESIGPVELCPGSHREGLVRVYTKDPNHPDKSGAYALRLEDEERRVARYPRIAPLCEPGDLLLMDFLTLHRSGFNRSHRTRWSMQSRLFNFSESTGIRIGWRGAFAAGSDLRSIHPELYLDAPWDRAS